MHVNTFYGLGEQTTVGRSENHIVLVPDASLALLNEYSVRSVVCCMKGRVFRMLSGFLALSRVENPQFFLLIAMTQSQP